jgi:hypothetical protein
MKFLLQKNILDMDIAPSFKINFNGIESMITNNRNQNIENISEESTNFDPMESHDAIEGI